MSPIEFGDLFEFIRNGMNVKQDKSGDGLPISRIETIWNSSIDPERLGYAGLDEDKCKGWLLSPGDILFSHINSVEHIGKCAVYEGVPSKLVHGMNLLCLRCKPEVLLPEYAKYLIRSSAFKAKLNNYINKAVNQASISIGNLTSIKVTVPSIPEQRRIAAILDKADALRAKRREALAQLDRLAQSIFVEMFGDPVTNPNKLAKEPLGGLIKVRSGDFLPASEMATDGQYPVFGGNGVNGYHDEYMFDHRQIVVGRVGVYCGCVHMTPANCWVTDNALYVSDHDPKIDFDFLAYSLKLANLNQYASQSAQPLISGARIYPVEIFVPPKEQQAEFITRVAAIQKVNERCSDASKELDALFESLQHRAFQGEL